MTLLDSKRAKRREYDQRRQGSRSGPRTSHGKKKSKFDLGNFLCWDGEGLQKGEKQVYGLLANSNHDFWIDTNGLSTVNCLYALTDPVYPNTTTHVCFGASYDVNMMLGDIPEHLLRQLHKGHKRGIRWREFDLEYRPRKSLTVRRYKAEERDGRVYRFYDHQKHSTILEKSVILYDCFGFFQKKFVGVLNEWFAGTPLANKYRVVIDDIILGKQKRGQFTEDEVKTFVLPYCLSECEALKDVMQLLHGYLTEAGLVLSRWDGAGAVAAALLKLHNIKEHIKRGPKLEYAAEPSYVTLASEFAYYGGWIEAYKFGHIDHEVYHGDIKSGYPAEEVKLQSLMHGSWKIHDFGRFLPAKEVEELLRSLPSFFVAHIEWECPDRYVYLPCPFSWRNKIGNVSRPLQGRGWQWSPEVLAAMDVCPDVQIKVRRIYSFHPSEEVYPFKFIEDIYRSRAEHKRLKKGMEKVEKLEMNSTYGKLAQSLGYDEETGLKPPYHCLTYAGLITSGTRAKILRVVMQHPESIISIATDGVYSLSPLDLDIGDGLGQWEYTVHKSMTLVQSGVYWYSTEEDGEIKESHYYRGFNDDTIKREDVINAYKTAKLSLPVETTRFITLGAAIGLNDFSKWRTWRTIKRELDLWMQHSSKRVWYGEQHPLDPLIFISRAKQVNPEFFKLYPEHLESHQYQFDWNDPPVDGQSFREFVEDMFTMELSGDE